MNNFVEPLSLGWAKVDLEPTTKIGVATTLTVYHDVSGCIFSNSPFLFVFQLAYCVVQFLEKDATLTDQVCTLHNAK